MIAHANSLGFSSLGLLLPPAHLVQREGNIFSGVSLSTGGSPLVLSMFCLVRSCLGEGVSPSTVWAGKRRVLQRQDQGVPPRQDQGQDRGYPLYGTRDRTGECLHPHPSDRQTMQEDLLDSFNFLSSTFYSR